MTKASKRLQTNPVGRIVKRASQKHQDCQSDGESYSGAKSKLGSRVLEMKRGDNLPSSTKDILKRQIAREQPIKVIDLFSGCGGLSHGLSLAGLQTRFAVDTWGQALATLEHNHRETKAIEFDLGARRLAPLLAKLEDVDVIVGGPPCQGFSISGKRDPSDPRNKLYKGFLNLVAEIRPQSFVMENVPNLNAMNNGALIQEIDSDFTNLGYKTTRQVLLASDYGVPQNRKRLILIGTLSDQPFCMPSPTSFDLRDKVTCHQAIGDLPEESVPDGGAYQEAPFSNYQMLMRSNSNHLFNHQTTNHSEQTRRIIGLVPDGGNYKNLPAKYRKIRNVNIAWTRYSSGKPSFTIDTGHRHHFHYLYDRVPTVRESARLQSFADDFIFLGSKTDQYKQVGNAVPPLLAQELGKALAKHLLRLGSRDNHAI